METLCKFFPHLSHQNGRIGNYIKVLAAHNMIQRILTYFARGSITVELTSCLTDIDLTKQVNQLLIQYRQSRRSAV